MGRNKRTAKYETLDSAEPVQGQPETPETAGEPETQPSAMKRNPYAHQPQGFRPKPPSPKPTAQKRDLRRRMLYFAVMIALFSVFAFAAYQVIMYLVQTSQAIYEEEMIQTMIAESVSSEDPAVTPTPSPTTTAVPEDTPSLAPGLSAGNRYANSTPAKPAVLIQFNRALAINPDTVGQLQMGESINTYVVQRDNSYYLRRSFSGEYSFSGAIFLDVSCSIYPQSRNLIIHGHNMQNGTAFGKLSRYEDIDYLNRYPFIEFSTLYETARYIPFAVVYFSIDPNSEEFLDLYQINSMTDQEFIRFVNDVQFRSEYHIPVNVAKTDKILTITTCATSDPDTRFAVFAVKSDIL